MQTCGQCKLDISAVVYIQLVMSTIVCAPRIIEKLRDKHRVSVREVEQCFENRCGDYLIDDREDHATDPVTLWFVAPTNQDRLLKVAFIFENGNVHIKSAFEPGEAVIALYDKVGK